MAHNPGIVYFISAYHMVQCGYFKIGITRQPNHKQRIRQIQSHSPFAIIEVCIVKHQQPEILEQMVLKKFRRYRIRGEWFAITGPLDTAGRRQLSQEFEEKVKTFMIDNSDGEVY